jgi:hypothetical protein
MNSGVFFEPAELYHANREAIGSTELRQMKLSPAHFYSAWKNNEEKASTKEMDMGSCLHSLLLEQDIAKYAARPMKNGRLVASNTNEYKEWEAANEGKIGLHPDFYNGLYDALCAFTKNETAMKMIKDAKIEQSAYARCPITGLWVKARADIRGAGYLTDLKSTKKIDENFVRSIFRMDYPFQLAHYGETFRLADGSETKSFYIMAFETAAPFGIKIFRIPMVYIEEALLLRQGWLNEIKVCLQENKWPGYREEIIEAIRPAYFESDSEGFEVAV